MLQAVDLTTGQVVNPGDTVTDFRGETGVFRVATRVTGPGSGKVVVNGREYYDRVWNLAVRDTTTSD